MVSEVGDMEGVGIGIVVCGLSALVNQKKMKTKNAVTLAANPYPPIDNGRNRSTSRVNILKKLAQTKCTMNTKAP